MQEGTNSLRKLRRDWWKTKLCTACVSPLGRFLSRGWTCPQCGLRVCKNCRSECQSGTWVCVLCDNSGGIPSEDLSQTTKSLGRDARSIRRSWTISNPQRTQTNSPILKSYTVLYPEDGEGVMTDGSGGCGSSNDSVGGAGCSVSAGHLSTIDDVNGGGYTETKNGRKFFLGRSHQGINTGNSTSSYNRGPNSAIIGVGHHQTGCVNQRKNSNCNDNGDDDDAVNGLSKTRQFNSLPRMNCNSSGGLSLFEPSSSSSPSSAVARALGLANKVGKRSFNSEFEKENIKRHRSFQTTLHPYNPLSQVNNPPPSPATSVNFIEETFWDYYDYELENSSSDPSSTPRNIRKSATAAAISDLAVSKRPIDNSKTRNTKTIQTFSRNSHPQAPKSANIVAFRTDSNRSSCERSLGEIMDYDCSLRMNQFSSLSDTEINDTSKYDDKKKQNLHPPSTSGEHRRHSNEMEKSPHSSRNYHPAYYATIASTKNPYLPASEYVYRRRHDEMLNEAPPKPERKSRNGKRSVSLNAYDGRRLFSPLKTYCVLMKENIEPENKPENNVPDGRHNFHLASHYDGNSGTTNPVISTPTSSAIPNNSSPISLSFTNSGTPLKFNSLPRERFIRIEREEGQSSMNGDKYSSLKYPSRKNEVLLGKSSTGDHYQNPISLGASGNGGSKGKNVTRVPITNDDDFPTHHPNFAFTNNFSPAKNKIERSQSYREISSSRPYPYYHHYHPHHQQSQNTATNHQASSPTTATCARSIIPQEHNRHNLSTSYTDKSPTTTTDLNFMHTGKTTTLPTNFRTKGKPTTSSLSVWEGNKQDSEMKSGNGSGNFFRSDFDDGSDVVIENFIKTHSSNTTSNNESNTLPKRKYPPSTTHISLSHNQPRRGSDSDYYYDKENVTASNKSDFKEANFQRDETSDNYLSQCSTFPRGASSQAKYYQKDDMDSTSPTKSHIEQLPNFYKNNTSNNNVTRNNSSSNYKGYPHHDELDIFFHPTNSTNKTSPSKEFDNVPKQQREIPQNITGNGERIVPIKLATMTAGPGSSATLPHPYIRRNRHVMTNDPEKPHQTGGVDVENHETKENKGSSKNSGPSISQVEMDIERDIFYQKTRSLDRARPSSKSKLKSVLSFGKSNGGENTSNAHSQQQQQQFPTMEIDYSDSQPYKNKGRLHEKLFSIDQVDRNYANARNKDTVGDSSNINNNVTSDLLQPQQIHHSHSSGNVAAPIPSPRLKRKAKLQQEPMGTATPQNTTLCSPKINGDEMSSSTSSSTKLIGPGTNYGSKSMIPPSNAFAVSSNISTRLLNEPNPYTQQHQHETSTRGANGVKTNAPHKSSTNPIYFGSSPSLNTNSQSGGSNCKINLLKETSMKADQPHNQHPSHSATFIGMSYNGSGSNGDDRAIGVDGTIKSEKSTGANHISQPSSGPVTPNYANSDSPGVNFMISNSKPTTTTNNSSLAYSPTAAVTTSEFDLHEQPQSYSSSPSGNKHLSDLKTRAMHTTPLEDQNSPLNHYQIKSALANNNSSNLPESGKLANGSGKAVRFEPHVIAMEIESEQRRLMQQQQMNQQPQQISGTSSPLSSSASSPSAHNNNSNNGINSTHGGGVAAVDGSNNSYDGTVSGLKSNPGNHMHRHGHNANKGGTRHPQQHYVHASSYLPVLYHSYHQQHHKYIRKGTGGNGNGAGSGIKSGKKSKKYKGFVARAIAKVKSKAAAAASKKESSSTTESSAPTVYYPAGKVPGNNSKGNISSNLSSNPAASSVITYISPQPQTQHQQPPVQLSLEERAALQRQELQSQQHKSIPPSITVSLSSVEDVGKASGKVHSNVLDNQSVSSAKGISDSIGDEIRKGASLRNSTSGGKLKKATQNKSAKVLNYLPAQDKVSGARRMDGYIDNLEEERHVAKKGEDGGMSIPDSFLLQCDRITPSSTSSSSSSFTSNLQESYELFHNDTLPENGNEMRGIKDAGACDCDDSDEEKCDSLNEDEDSDNANDEEDGPPIFKSFDESDFGEDEDDEEPDFVFYPAKPTISAGGGNGNKSFGSSFSPSSSARHHFDMDRNKAITSVVTSSTDVESYAPFANSNETTTRGNNKNNISNRSAYDDDDATSSSAAPFQYSDLTSDKNGNKSGGSSHNNNAINRNKGKSSLAEPKMVVGIPTYRSPNSKKLINSHNHYGKSQPSVPNASPTTKSSPLSSLSKPKENVKQPFTSLLKEPHPSFPQEQSSNSSNNAPTNYSRVATSEEDNSLGASFGTHRDSFDTAHQRTSSNNRYLSISTEDVRDNMKKGLSQQQVLQVGKNSQQHSKNENQVNDEKLHDKNVAASQSQQSQSFVPFHDKNCGKDRHHHHHHENLSAQMYERGRNRDYDEHQEEHTQNVDHDYDDDVVDEDTLQQQDALVAGSVKNAMSSGNGNDNVCISPTKSTTTSHSHVADYTNSEERVSSASAVNPHDAKGFKKISTSQEGIASAVTTTTTAGNSTGATVSNKTKNEGRLSDLTTCTANVIHSQQQLAASATIDEQGLQYGTSTNAKFLKSKDAPCDSPNAFGAGAAGGDQKLLNLKNNSLLHQQNQNEIFSLQARTSSSSSSPSCSPPPPFSWASSKKSLSNINSVSNNTDRQNHNTVTSSNNEKRKDVERLQRLELVKSHQHNILTHINNSQHQKGNFKSGEPGGDVAPSDPQYYYSLGAEQPNSLETQCANDQSFLSESEVSSGKSPSPSPRFKTKKFGGKPGGGSRIPHPKFNQSHHLHLKKSGIVGDEGGSEQEQTIHHHHLLNTLQTRNSPKLSHKAQQSKNQSIAQTREQEESQVQGSSRIDKSQDEDTLLCPDSGPTGMSILPPQHQHHTKATSASTSSVNETSNVGKFKSRVLLNSDDLEDDEELSRDVADVLSKLPVSGGGSQKCTANGGGQSQSGKKNITTVEISGDVGIVSNNLLHNVANVPQSPTNSHSINNNSNRQRAVPSDHLQSSGLSLIKQPNLLDLHSSSEDDEEDFLAEEGTSSNNIEKPIEPEIKTKLIRRVKGDPFSLAELGSSVSANESSGDNDTEKTSDSSDWQSESTNTVIFRGNQAILPEDPISSPFYASSNNYQDPEIQINNIVVGDNHEYIPCDANGNGVTTSNDHTSAENSGVNSVGKVNVGYKANKVNKVSTDLIIGIKKSSADNTNDGSSLATNLDVDGTCVTKIGSKRKFDKGNDVSSSSSSSSSAIDSSEELGKSNETLTDIPAATHPDQAVAQCTEEEEVEMVMHSGNKAINGDNNSTRLYVPSNTKSPHHRRESPEGQEQEVPDQNRTEDNDKKLLTNEKVKADTEKIHPIPIAVVPNAKEKKMDGGDGGEENGGGSENTNGHKSKRHGKSVARGTISKEKILQNVLSQIPSRSSPDGADKSDRDATPEPEVESPTPATGVVDSFDVTSDEDSWVEEILFEDEDDTSFEEAVKKLPPPLDLTLHTIVEESCEESEAENSGNFYQPSTSGIGGSQKNTSLSQSESNANELEKYFNFGIYTDHNSGSKNSLPHEESEFSDTFSESSFSLQEDDFDSRKQEGPLDPAELASTRLEKYFYNLGGPHSMMSPMSSTIISQNADSDSVGSESDSDNSVLEKRKKVLKHHRRSADFDEEFGDKVSDEEDNFGFGQDGFDTIKKTARKAKRSGSEGSITNESSTTIAANQSSSGTSSDKADNDTSPSSPTPPNKSSESNKKSNHESSSTSKISTNSSGNEKEKAVIKVNRSNSFTWSSDEEVNIMMSKLRQLIKNLIKSKVDSGNNTTTQSSTSQTGESSGSGNKDKQLVYLENELIRLMKTDNLKNIVEYLSSEESDVDDVYKFIKVVNSAGSTPVDLDDLGDLGDLDIDDPNLLENLQSTMQLQSDGTPGASPKSSPALLAKVMHHIGNRLNMWMKDEGNLEEDNNDDSATLKCAPSVSSDLNEDRFSWKGSFESALAAKRQSVGSTDSISSSDYGQDKSMLRSSSLHHLTTTQPIEENKEEEESNSSLPRMTNLCNSLPRLNQPTNPAISRAHSLVMTGKNEQQLQQQPGTETYPVSISGPVKSARYRPPGFQPSMKAKRIDTEEKASPAILSQSTPVLAQDSTNLKNRSDSMGSIAHDVKLAISVKGQVEFGLQYNYKLACLEVKVTGCRDLASADSKRNRSDPYVKAYLLPDKSKAGKRKTKTKKNTLNPVFDEILKFPLTLSDLQKRTLWLSVWHSDMFGKNEFLGEILVPLKDRVFDDPNPGWWDLQEMSGQMEDMPKGDVVIALKWTPKTDSTGNLSVLVKEAKNLVPVKNGSPSTFVKCALLSEKTRKQKTSICRRNFNPIWNQTLLFEDVDDEGVEITIWNHDLLASHDLIGTVRLEYDNPLWESMISRPSFWVEGGLKLS